MSAEADGDCVSLEAYLNSLDGSDEGYRESTDCV